MPRSGYYEQHCPHAARRSEQGESSHVAVCLQLTTIGETPRRRAPAVTLYPCDECIRLMFTKRGRPLRKALAAAVQKMSVQLARQKGVDHGPH
jgi:hypothetical protein